MYGVHYCDLLTFFIYFVFLDMCCVLVQLVVRLQNVGQLFRGRAAINVDV